MRRPRAQAFALALGGAALASAAFAHSLGPGAATLVCGHRGTGKDVPGNPYPENTLPSIARGLDEGSHMIEIDVQLSGDGVVVLWHDAHAEVGGRRRRVEEVAAADLPTRPGPDGRPVAAPSLDQALQLVFARAPHPEARVMDVEVKVHSDAERAPLVAAVAAALRAAEAVNRVVVSSFDLETLRQLEARLPGLVTGFLHHSPDVAFDTVRAENARGGPRIEWVLHGPRFAAGGLTPEGAVAAAREAGVRVGMWTVNRRWMIWRLVAAGYDMVISDAPDVARQVVDGPGPWVHHHHH